VSPPLPKITLTASDYPRLEQLARMAAQQGDLDGMFLMGEITRAQIVPDDGRDAEAIATIGSWVSYWTNWGVPPKTVQLAWPEDCGSDPARVSVLSSLGAALIGLRSGDQMPFFVAGSLNVVTVQNVQRLSPNVIPLFRPYGSASAAPFDDDPGPTAA